MKTIAVFLTILLPGVVLAGSNQEIDLIWEKSAADMEDCCDTCSKTGSACRSACYNYYSGKDQVDRYNCIDWCDTNEGYCRQGCGVNY